MELNQRAKLLIDSFTINYNDQIFNLGIEAGPNELGFCLPPKGMKNLLHMIESQVAEYEKKFGEINMDGVDFGIKSPFPHS